MDKNLQAVNDFIQQDPNMAAEQKESVLKSIKAVDKELQILSFKLDRTEKVKRTTAILLEETIEELEQKRKAVEEALTELKATQTQLIQQEKLASLGQLTAGIAHEIKNPLNFVNNFSELSMELVEEVRDEIRRVTDDRGPGISPLEGSAEEERRRGVSSPFEGGKDGKAGQGDGPDSKTDTDSSSSNTPLPSEASAQAGLILDILNDIEANLKTIHKHGSRADSIVKSMLQHSRGGDGVMEPTLLNPLIKEYVNLAFHGMRAGKEPINVDIELQLDENVGEVPLVAEDFSRVILNLCNNAFDAMREKLLVVSGQSSVLYQPKLTVRTKSEGSHVIIEIEDNGPGIPDEIKDKILQPFFTTKKGTAGTGLGLSITNDIIKAHGGNLDVYSINNAGSRFVIQLSIKR